MEIGRYHSLKFYGSPSCLPWIFNILNVPILISKSYLWLVSSRQVKYFTVNNE